MRWVQYDVAANDGAKVHHNCEAAKGCCVFFARRGGVKGTNRTYIHTKNKESTLHWVLSLSVCVCLRMQESFDFDVSLNFLHVFL